MENKVLTVKGAVTAALAWLTAQFGILGPLLLVLIISMIADYITGLVRAGMQGKISSSQGLRGIVKKLLYMVAAGVGVGVDWLLIYLTSSLGISLPVQTFFGALVCVWLILNEWVSMLENVSDYVKLPAFLTKVLQKAKSTVEEVGDKQADVPQQKQ